MIIISNILAELLIGKTLYYKHTICTSYYKFQNVHEANQVNNHRNGIRDTMKNIFVQSKYPDKNVLFKSAITHL